MKSSKHEQIIRDRNTRTHRIVILFRQVLIIMLVAIGIWELNKNRDLLTSVAFL
ncbi:MAG: hypothetical protein WCK88_07615 [bacterium]